MVLFVGGKEKAVVSSVVVWSVEETCVVEDVIYVEEDSVVDVVVVY